MFRSLVLAVAVFALAAPAATASSAPRAVSLADAHTPPAALVYLRAGESVTPPQCGAGHYFTETSAYGWRGRALSAQRWNADHDRTYWRASTGRVVFDGVTFRNRSRRPVLVAGWCS